MLGRALTGMWRGRGRQKSAGAVARSCVSAGMSCPIEQGGSTLASVVAATRGDDQLARGAEVEAPRARLGEATPGVAEAAAVVEFDGDRVDAVDPVQASTV